MTEEGFMVNGILYWIRFKLGNMERFELGMEGIGTRKMRGWGIERWGMGRIFWGFLGYWGGFGGLLG